MRKFIILLCILVTSLVSYAQQAKQEIMENPYLSASNYLAYRGPQKALTPAPKGYKPFYITHYGRHGSRYLINEDEYNAPLKVMSEAHDKGKLTPLGEDVLKRLKMIKEESRKREGELTQLGAEQHKDIALRMYQRFPEVFKGNVCIDAKSTIVIRCILSMENELQQFLVLNPKLNITHDASEHDMYYMNLRDQKLRDKRMPQRARVALNEFEAKHPTGNRQLQMLFNDAEYIHHEVDGGRFTDQLFKLASNLQSTELRKEITLYDIFTNEELYEFWLKSNAWWYISYGACPLNGGKQPFSQRNLLRNIIHQADSCIALEKPGATLRFGHETMVMPLTCLLGLNHYDQQINDLNKLEEKGWINYKVFPMGANIQFIFYRKQLGGDVLLKVLLNEDEASLPIPTDNFPYYKWNDFRDYYLNKIDGYMKEKENEGYQ